MLPNVSRRVVRGVDAAFVVTTLDPFNPMQNSDLGTPWTDGDFSASVESFQFLPQGCGEFQQSLVLG
jgi:hypothetical protein